MAPCSNGTFNMGPGSRGGGQEGCCSFPIFLTPHSHKGKKFLQNQVPFNPLTHSFSLASHIPPRLPEASTSPHLSEFSLCSTHSESIPATLPCLRSRFPSALFLIFMTFHAFVSAQGWALCCFPFEGNSVFKMDLWGCIKLYAG